MGLTSYAAFVIYALGIIAIASTIFYKIEIGIYFFCFFLPLQNVLNYAIKYPLGKDLNDLVLMAMLIGWFIDRRRTGDKFFVQTPINKMIIILALWTYLQTWRGTEYVGLPAPISISNPLFVSWKNYMFSPLIFLIVANNIKNKKQIRWLMLIMIFAIFALDRNFYSVIKDLDRSHYDSTALKVNVSSSALGGNQLAVFLAQYSAVILSLFLLDHHKVRKVCYGVPLLLSYYCIMFLFSRSGYLAVLASAATIGIIKDRKFLVGLFALLILWNTVLPTAVQERIAMTKSDEGWDSTTQERLGMWEQAKAIISEQPLIGVGFDVTSQLAVQAEGFEGYTWHSFHNNYLQTVAEIGIIGLGIILFIYILAFRKGWQLYRIADDGFLKGLGLGMMACVPAILFGNIAGSYWQYYNIIGYFYVILALVVRGIKIIQQEQERTGIVTKPEDFSELSLAIPQKY
ncbi:MAG: O-antigen ligase family protein [candidate division KSB1 bacterium]|nr:O-antigen ligase family protein [candidate division KSB1 bacterium]MDZ7336508.1 O-antigen ligase family protein [candidate division KSB1 bacterium]MDZ7341276.1 O-antigen ligase family protein [candidate division KSB1 bacterium]